MKWPPPPRSHPLRTISRRNRGVTDDFPGPGTFAVGKQRSRPSPQRLFSLGRICRPDDESQESAENSLTFALLWLQRAGQMSRRGFLAGLRPIVAQSACRAVAHRFHALDPKIKLELYEYDPVRETRQHFDWCSNGNLDSWLVPHRESQALLHQARAALDPIVALSPQAITVHPVVESREVWLRFRGLAVARRDDGKVFFGDGDAREKLSSASWHALKRLVDDLENHRHPVASETRHALYRSQPERWFESIVREDVTCIDVALDPRFVYAQVFANAGGEHGILDLLRVPRTGWLAVLELKAAEHIHLPLQSADYWLRVRRHLEQGDFARYGYFAGSSFRPRRP